MLRNMVRKSGLCCTALALGAIAVVSADEKQATDASKINPDRQIVFTVEGLTCPAVKGLGCGHRIAPVLTRVSELTGVEQSATNWTGTMLRISTLSTPDRDKVAESVAKLLTDNGQKPVRLTGEKLQHALVKEEWRSPLELTTAEFHTLGMNRLKSFAESEKLDEAVTAKLVQIAEREWDRIAARSDTRTLKQPEQVRAQFMPLATIIPEQSKELLTAEQLERFKQALSPVKKN